jgi:hypothetical protein
VSDTERGDGTFLSRWSERKLHARRGQELAEPADTPQAAADRPSPTAAADESERLLTDEDMPPLESLDADSDYSGFLSRGVSEALRRKALSKLFRGAHFNVTDGLDDYAEDFTKFAPLGDIVTADMRYRMEQAAKRLLGDEDPEARLASGADEVAAEQPSAPASEPAADPDQDPTEGDAV